MKKVDYTDKALKEMEKTIANPVVTLLMFSGFWLFVLTFVVTAVIFIFTGDVNWEMFSRAMLVAFGLMLSGLSLFAVVVGIILNRLNKSDEEKLL